MANYNLTPNMGLPNPIPGVDPGPDYANNIQSSLNILDQHNHSPPNGGVQINPTGMNINASLPFNNNLATTLKATVFTQQASLATLNALFVGTDGNLYFNDGAGDPSIQITAGGLVNATSSGISSGTATASFVSSVLVVNAASNTPANIQSGSILLGNNSSGSKFLTLAPPSAMGSNITETLPTIPGATSIMQMDTSGNMSAALVVDNSTIVIASGILKVPTGGITTTQIADQTIAQGDLALRATGSTVAAGGFASSSSCGVFLQTAVTSYAPVTNLSITITTTGRPVYVGLQGAVGTFGGNWQNGGSGTAWLALFRGVTQVSGYIIDGPTCPETIPPSFLAVDAVAAGTYTYTLQAKCGSGTNQQLRDVILVAYEI